MHTINVLGYVAAIALALGAGLVLNPPPTESKKEILRALMRVADVHPTPHDGRIVIGYNANVDVVASAVPVMEQTISSAGIGKTPAADSQAIDSSATMDSTFSHFFGQSAAAERFVEDEALLNKLVANAEALEGTTMTIGGNAALMGLQFAAEGFQVSLAAKVGSVLRDLVGESVVLEGPHVENAPDAKHLILEYSKGDKYGSATADRANRFIVSNDVPDTAGFDQLHDNVAANAGQANAVVIAGLHLLEALEDDERSAKLAHVTQQLSNLRKLAKGEVFHLELASIGDKSFLASLAANVFPLVDSIGANDQEVADLFEALGGEYDAHFARGDIAAHVPKPQGVAQAVRFILSKHDNLSRVHFHSLAFHLVAQRASSSTSWGSAAASAAAGAVTATLRACQATEPELHGNDVGLKLRLRVPVADLWQSGSEEGATKAISSKSPVAEWAWSNNSGASISFSVAPVVVCNEPKQTVGLGDAVSASGLAAHLKF